MLEVAKGARLLGSTNLKDYPDKGGTLSKCDERDTQIPHFADLCRTGGTCGHLREGERYISRRSKKNFPGPETIGALEGRPFRHPHDRVQQRGPERESPCATLPHGCKVIFIVAT